MKTDDDILGLIQNHVDSYRAPPDAKKRGFLKTNWRALIRGAGVLSLAGLAIVPAHSVIYTVMSLVLLVSWVHMMIEAAGYCHAWGWGHVDMNETEKTLKQSLLLALQKHPELKERFTPILPALLDNSKHNLSWKCDLLSLLRRLHAKDTPTHAYLDAQIRDLVFGKTEHQEFRQDTVRVESNKSSLKSGQQDHWRF